MLRTFRIGGIHPPENKLSAGKKIEVLATPKQVIIPLGQHIGAPAVAEVKKGDLERVTFRNEQLRKFFPRSYTAQQMQDTIIKLLDQWQKKKSREHER